MQKVQVLATAPWNVSFPFYSWLVRFTQITKESSVVWYFPENKIIRIANLKEIKEINIDEFMKKNRLTNMKTISLTEKQYEDLSNYTKSKLGKQSGGFLTAAGFIVVQFLRKFFKLKIKNPFNKAMTSAEYIREGSRKIDELVVFVLTHNIPQGNFNTEDAMELTSELSDKY
jgi:hypothetical protein